MGFFGELKRRNVFRVAIAFAIVAWLVVQVADIVLENIGAPAWVMQTMLLVLALGFIVTAMFAWAYEVTPEGIRRESEVDRSASITRVTGRRLDQMIVGLLVVSLAYFVWEARFAGHDEGGAPDTPAAVKPAAEEDAVFVTPASDLSIAVLPFDNRSALPEDAFFADGMHDDLLTTLAKIGSLKVISRTSVMQYRNTTMTVPEIARKLGVANILEGGVQRAGNQVRINVQLINAETDEHVWAEIFDRELTAENLFAIQSEISKAVAEALQATLSPAERQRIDTTPTDSLEAFDHYLRGRVLLAKRTTDEMQQATQEFLKAVELDPKFALAWVGVADAQCLISSRSGADPEDHLETCRRAIDRALEIDPEFGEAYAALGILLMRNGDVSGAEEALKTAIQLKPNYASAYHWLSNMLSYNSFRAQEALPYAQRAAELDPESGIILSNLAGAYLRFGDFENARRYLDRLAQSHPELPQPGFALFYWETGNFVAAIDEYRKAASLDPDNPFWISDLTKTYLEVGAVEEARQARDFLMERYPGVAVTRLVNAWLARAEGHTGNVRAQVTEILQGQPSINISFEAALIALWNGDLDLAFKAFDQASRGALGRGELNDSYVRDWAPGLCPVAWALLEAEGKELLGAKLLEESIALYENELATQVNHPERFGFHLCYLLNGDRDRALAELEKQSENNFTGYLPYYLSLPPYDTLRDDPRFVALSKRFKQHRAEQLAELRRRDQTRPAFEF